MKNYIKRPIAILRYGAKQFEKGKTELVRTYDKIAK